MGNCVHTNQVEKKDKHAQSEEEAEEKIRIEASKIRLQTKANKQFQSRSKLQRNGRTKYQRNEHEIKCSNIKPHICGNYNSQRTQKAKDTELLRHGSKRRNLKRAEVMGKCDM